MSPCWCFSAKRETAVMVANHKNSSQVKSLQHWRWGWKIRLEKELPWLVSHTSTRGQKKSGGIKMDSGEIHSNSGRNKWGWLWKDLEVIAEKVQSLRTPSLPSKIANYRPSRWSEQWFKALNQITEDRIKAKSSADALFTCPSLPHCPHRQVTGRDSEQYPALNAVNKKGK